MRIHNYSDDYDADTLCDIFECLDCPRYADDCDGDTLCDIFECLDCPRYADDCDGDTDKMIEEGALDEGD